MVIIKGVFTHWERSFPQIACSIQFWVRSLSSQVPVPARLLFRQEFPFVPVSHSGQVPILARFPLRPGSHSSRVPIGLGSCLGQIPIRAGFLLGPDFCLDWVTICASSPFRLCSHSGRFHIRPRLTFWPGSCLGYWVPNSPLETLPFLMSF